MIVPISDTEFLETKKFTFRSEVLEFKIMEEFLIVNTRKEVFIINLHEAILSDIYIIKNSKSILLKDTPLEEQDSERFSLSEDKKILAIFNSNAHLNIYELGFTEEVAKNETTD